MMKFYTYSKIVIFTFLVTMGFSNENVKADASLVSVCATGQLLLTINFDNNPEQIGWDIKDVNNTIYANAVYGSYANEVPGSSLVITIPTLPDGDYVLVMIDAGGDGLCCNNGNGSYTLEDDNGTFINGTISGYSDVTQFCMNVTNGDVIDTQAPTAPVFTVSNVTDTSADLAWTASSDNVGVTDYGIFNDGVYLGNTNQLGGTIPTLTPNTMYNMYVVSRDLIGNFSDPSNVESYTTTGGGPVETVVHEGYFETGWDGWSDGGNDCSRYSGNKSYEGDYSIRIRDNSGVASSMTSQDFDLSSFDEVKVTFHYYVRSMESGEDFWLRLFENGAWTTVEDFVKGTDFNGNGFYYAEVIIPSSTYTFDMNNKFRFQCDASGNNDKIFIDEVIVTGINNPSNRSSSSPFNHGQIESFLSGGNTNFYIPHTQSLTRSTEVTDFTTYPNPVHDLIYFRDLKEESVDQILIYDLTGQIMISSKYTNFLDVSSLQTGNYIVAVVTKEGLVEIRRITKM